MSGVCCRGCGKNMKVYDDESEKDGWCNTCAQEAEVGV